MAPSQKQSDRRTSSSKLRSKRKVRSLNKSSNSSCTKKKPERSYKAKLENEIKALSAPSKGFFGRVIEYTNNIKEFVKSLFSSKVNNDLSYPKKPRRFHQVNYGTARKIFAILLDQYMCRNIDSSREFRSKKLNLIKETMQRFDSLDTYIFSRILLIEKDKLPCHIDKIISSKRYCYIFFIAYMRMVENGIDLVMKLFQSWFLIKPVTVEILKYTNGQINDDMDLILTNLNELHKYLSKLKKEAEIKYYK